MSLESGTYISDLVATNPAGTDPKSQGDDHLRLIKSTLKNTFPQASGLIKINKDVSILGDGTKVAIGTATEDALQIDGVAKIISALAPYHLLPSGPAFRADPAVALGFGNVATWEQKIFKGESFDTNGAYDTGTGRFQPTIPGIYQVTLRMVINAAGGGLGTCYAAVRKNGTEVLSSANSSTPTECGVEVNGLVQMNGTTDYLESWAYVESGSTVSVAESASLCEFSASLVHA